MKKVDIIQELIRRQEQTIFELKEKMQLAYSMVDLDESDTLDPEDYSHSYEAHEIHHITELQLVKAEQELERMRSIDTSESSIYQMGSIVETEQFNFIIGFAVLPFTFMSKSYVGISKDSPIYPLMLQTIIGKTFAYNGHQYTILNIR